MQIFKLVGSIFVDSAAANESISKTEKKAEGLGAKLGSGIKTAGKWALGVGAAAAAVGAAMMGAATKVAGTADEIDKASRRAGTSAENWQKLNYAMGQSGISSQTLEKSMVKNQKALNEAANGTGKAANAYKDLGISIKNADGSLRDADDVYQDTLKSLADMTDINERNRLANDLFGKSYSDLAPILDAGSEGIDQLTSRAEQLGLVLSQETVDAGVKFGDTLDDVKQAGGAIFNMIAAELLPMLQIFLDFIIEHAPQIQAAVGTVVDFVMGVIGILKAFWQQNSEEIMAITTFLFETIKSIIEGAMNIIKGIIDVVMGIITGDWDRAWAGIKNIVSGAFIILVELVKAGLVLIVNVIVGAGKLLFNAGKSLMNFLWDGIKSIWDSICSWVTERVEWLADELMFWKKGSDEMSSEPQPKPKKPKPDGRHASGLAYVPYDGYTAELHKGETVLNAQDTKGLLNDIATLMAGNGQSKPISLTANIILDGKTLARQTFQYFQDESSRRGKPIGGVI